MFWKPSRPINQSVPEPQAPPPARRFTDRTPKVTTTIGPGLTIVGTITGDDSCELSGTLDGDVKVAGLCHLKETARVSGRIEAASVVVEGTLEGEIAARHKVELGPRAVVRGSVRAASIAIAEGCFLDADVHMHARPGASGTPGQSAFREKRGSGRRD